MVVQVCFFVFCIHLHGGNLFSLLISSWVTPHTGPPLFYVVCLLFRVCINITLVPTYIPTESPTPAPTENPTPSYTKSNTKSTPYPTPRPSDRPTTAPTPRPTPGISYIGMYCSEESGYSTYDASDSWYKSGYYLLNGMDSYHSNYREDRIFKMKYCRSSSSTYWGLSSDQTLPYTDWDECWSRGCGGNSGIYYVYSYHSNYYEDRRFLVRCADLGNNNVQLTDCGWYGYYPSSWDGRINFECPSSGIIRTIESYHSNSVEDRKYKFECCRMIESRVALVTMTSFTSSSYSNGMCVFLLSLSLFFWGFI